MGVPRARPSHRIRRGRAALHAPPKALRTLCRCYYLRNLLSHCQRLQNILRSSTHTRIYQNHHRFQCLRFVLGVRHGTSCQMTPPTILPITTPNVRTMRMKSPCRTLFGSTCFRINGSDPRTTPVQALPATSPLADTDDQWIRSLITQGTSLPPPLHAPRIFQATPVSDLMDQVITDLKQQGILQPQRITAAYRCFLVPNADRSARFVIDLSPVTALYRAPHITLYSAARVLSTR
jgi:hypothetical protein